MNATDRRPCPCQHVTPCRTDCSCVHPTSTAGCRRCCSWGSPEQQLATAKRLAEQEEELIEALSTAVAQGCTCSDGTLNSMCIGSYAWAMRQLALFDVVEILSDDGQRGVTARWKPLDPAPASWHCGDCDSDNPPEAMRCNCCDHQRPDQKADSPSS